jgi:hypothetical protein
MRNKHPYPTEANGFDGPQSTPRLWIAARFPYISRLRLIRSALVRRRRPHSPPPRRPHTTSPRRTPLARSPVPPGANFAGGERGGGHVGARLSPGGLALSWIGQLHSVSLVPSLSPSLSSQMGTGSYFSCALGVAYSSNQALIVLAMGMVQ